MYDYEQYIILSISNIKTVILQGKNGWNVYKTFLKRWYIYNKRWPTNDIIRNLKEN